MSTIESLNNWIEQNHLDTIVWDERTFSIKNKGKFFIVEPKEGLDEHSVLVNQEFQMRLSGDDFRTVSEDEGIEFFAFQFGTRWYYCEDPENVVLNELRYLGSEKDLWEESPPFLGVHGGYDLCNGSRSYDEWAKKAKFCNYKALGIAEENTLAGTLQFQIAMQKAGIKPIIGETIVVEDNQLQRYHLKLYVHNEQGWKNLLLINAQINVFNAKFVTEEFLMTHSEGLNCVMSPEVDIHRKYLLFMRMNWKGLYFQFDVSRWDSDERDKAMLLNTKHYLDERSMGAYSSLLPVLLSDAYYLEQVDARIRRDLNAIGKVPFKNQSKDQFFKTPNEIFAQIATLFRPDDVNFDQVAQAAMNGAFSIANTDFKIDTGKLYLPPYEMKEEEVAKWGDQENMFWGLVAEGLDRKITAKGLDDTPYVDRLETEMKVICDAKLHHYFLIIWDFLNFCHENGWITGYGRGSAAGSVVAFLLDIVQTDPLKYGLIFERFLNEGRLYKKKKIKGKTLYFEGNKVGESINWPYDKGDEWSPLLEYDGYELKDEELEIKVTGSMPDIDNDVPGEHRDEIKRYLEGRYGKHRVASIATYGTFQIKAALQALARRSGADSNYTRYVTGGVNPDSDYVQLFKDSNKESIFKYGAMEKASSVKEFIQTNLELIEKIPLVYGQPSTSSMHAGGVIIVPESEHGIYDQMPVKLVEGMLVSEWEMNDVEAAGFLKMDILGLKQLDKFMDMLSLIREQTGDEINLLDIPLDDKKVYTLFGKGYNEDVFQFGGFGLKGYTAGLKPENVDDLIATVALYRPGPIETGAHMQYVKRKNKEEKIMSFRGTEEILKPTYGLMAYQEQVMDIVKHLAGFTLQEADEVRKAIGKKIPELMKQQKDKFIDGAVKHGYPKDEMGWLWDQIEVFASYSFNKSHAACYAITGYHCQWLKANYPLQFWTTSLAYAKDDVVSSRLSEIYSAFPQIKLSPADINKSELTYRSDPKTKTIYWTISSVKQVGKAAVEAILEERNKNGHFFSVTEFATRMKTYSRACTKRTIVNLIIAGAFDEIEGVKIVTDRYRVLEKYLIFNNSKIEADVLVMKTWKDYRWVIEQKALSGLGVLDFKKLIHQTNLMGKVGKYHIIKDLLDTPAEEFSEEVLVAGLITKFDIKGRADKPMVIMEVTDGQSNLSGCIWNDAYEKFKELFYGEPKTSPVGKLVIMTAQIKFDDKYKKSNTFYSTKFTNLTIITD